MYSCQHGCDSTQVSDQVTGRHSKVSSLSKFVLFESRLWVCLHGDSVNDRLALLVMLRAVSRMRQHGNHIFCDSPASNALR